MTRLSAAQINVTRDARNILEQVSASFEGGELVAVIGPNGAGKSTFLGALAGLIPISRGRITLDEVPLEKLGRPALARKRAYIPQDPRCEWPITVERLVSLGLSAELPMFGPPRAEQLARIDATLRDCDLEGCRFQPATTLSGGELHRAMLARALVGDPPVLIFDEPTNGLDPRHTLDTMARFARLAASGRLVLIAMHDLTLAGRFATRILALKGGRLFADGPTRDQLTESLIRDVFEVEARLLRYGKDTFVGFE